jgi:cobalt/nickel transport system permease protein
VQCVYFPIEYEAIVQAEYLDHYSYLDSPIHRIPAPTKLAGALAAIFLILLVPVSFPLAYIHIFIALSLWAAAFVSRLPIKAILRRTWMMWVVIITLAAGRLLQPDASGRILQPEGVYHAITTLIRGGLCLAVMLMVANTSRFSEILDVLKHLYIPGILLTSLGLLYRYLFVLSDEMHRMRRAREARSFKSAKRHTWRMNANVIAHLFLRCAERAQRIHRAMLARGAQ